MHTRKLTPKTQFKPNVMKIDIDSARAHLPVPPRALLSSQRQEKPSTSSNSLFSSTLNTFPFGTSQNLSNTYRARTRQGQEHGQRGDFESKPYDSENFLAQQSPVTSLMQHHQKYRTFQANPAPSVKEKVPLTKFTFDMKSEEALTGNVEKFESLIENRNSKRISTTGSLSARFMQTSARLSTRANTESDYGVPFKETIPVKRRRFVQQPLENVSEFRRDTRPLGLKAEESFSSGYSAKDIADLDSKIAKTFRLKKDISTKYKSDIQTKEIEKKHASVRKLTNEELIMQNKDKLMVCVDNDEDITEKLKYCFVSRNIIRDSGTKITKTGVEFNIKLDEIVKKLKIDTKYKYLYLVNGTPVFELAHIPKNENVIIISKQIELRSTDEIIQDDLVKEFYEYGTNKDIMICSKSHIRSRMASLAQVQQMVEERYHDVLQLFDGGEQLDSAELGQILKTEDSKKTKELSSTINKFFSDKATKALIEESPARSQSTRRLNKMSDDTENLKTEEDEEKQGSNLAEEDAIEEEDEKTKKVKTYLGDRQPLSENTKLDLYQQINRFYKGELRKIKIEQEETEGNEDFQEETVTENEGRTKSRREEMNVGENLDILLKKWKHPKKKLEYFDIKKAMSTNTKKDLSNHSRTRLQDELVINQYDNLIDAPTLREKGMTKNFILDNKKNLQKKKGDILKLSKLNKELFLKNIPKNLEGKNLSRRELHYIYILYKALCEVTSQRHKEYNMGDGIDYHSFKNGIHQVFIQSDEVAEKIFYAIDCNFSGFLNWEEFIDAMVVIRAKTLRDKIDLFIKIADEDGNGSLSKEEIFKLAKICLKKFVTGGDETFLDNLCEYFTKLIFSSVDIDMDEEIPLQSIKQAIISGNPESDLLAMFCGADI